MRMESARLNWSLTLEVLLLSTARRVTGAIPGRMARLDSSGSGTVFHTSARRPESILTAPRSTLDNVAETLLFDLLDERSIQGRPELPFVLGLSLGDTQAKKLFIESTPSRHSRK